MDATSCALVMLFEPLSLLRCQYPSRNLQALPAAVSSWSSQGMPGTPPANRVPSKGTNT